MFMSRIINIIKRIISVLFHCLPVSGSKVYFQSFSGLYSDNPKYISEYLHKLNPNIKIYWSIDDRCQEMLPDYVHKVYPGSIKELFILNSCRVIVDNGAGIINAIVKKKYAYIYRLLKNKKQFNISTWHGTPTKKIGLDCIDSEKEDYKFISSSDVFMLGSKYEAEIFKNAYPNIPIRVCGYARNDILITAPSDKIFEIRKKNGFPINKKIVLYAPTFRDNTYMLCSQKAYDYLMCLDVEYLLQILHKKFEGEWIFVFRGHQFIQNKINYSILKEDLIYNGNKYDDMSEYLLVCDVLITDFSSSLSDFALTGKPCFLYAPDADDYIKNIRGIYGTLDDLPYEMNRTNEELHETIMGYDATKFKNKVQKYINYIGMPNIPKSSEEISKFIIKKCGSNL